MNPMAAAFTPQNISFICKPPANSMMALETPELPSCEAIGLVTPPRSVKSSVSSTPTMRRRSGQSSASSLFGGLQNINTPGTIVSFTPFETTRSKPSPRIPLAPAAMVKNGFNIIYTPQRSIFQQAQQSWTRYDTDIHRQWPADIPADRICPWIPRTFDQYVEHLGEIANMEKELAQMKEKCLAKSLKNIKTGSAFKGNIPGVRNSHVTYNTSNRASVLSYETIWCVRPYNNTTHCEAAWPSYEEFKWEGDSRIATEKRLFRRMFPLPRMSPGNPAWRSEFADYRVCPRNHTNEFDDLHPAPTIDEIHGYAEEIEYEDVELLLNKSLRDAIINSI